MSGSLGLGHIIRDLEIAKEIRKQIPDVELSWMASNPAKMLLKDAGETLLPESDLLADDNLVAENVSKGAQLNLLKYANKVSKGWANNIEVFNGVVNKGRFDLVIGDETHEISIGIHRKLVDIEPTFVMIFDIIGLGAMTKNPLERLGIYMWNRVWANSFKGIPVSKKTAFFVGEEEDVQDKRFDYFLTNRREWAREHCLFLGYILPFDPEEYKDKKKIRTELGYGEKPLVVCSLGGTSVGKVLLELCSKAYPIIKKKIPDLRMVLVCGPRLPADSLEVPEGIEVEGYVPALYEHFAACDLAVVLGGGTSTLELTALNRPFLFFPLEGHYEQQVQVVERLARHRAGIKMSFRETTPETLAEKVITNIGKEVNYASIPTDGAQKGAQLVHQLL